jgi:hypothetical protein
MNRKDWPSWFFLTSLSMNVIGETFLFMQIQQVVKLDDADVFGLGAAHSVNPGVAIAVTGL